MSTVKLSYDKLIANARALDRTIYCETTPESEVMDLFVVDGPLALTCRIRKDSDEGLDYLEKHDAYSGLPVELDEVRIYGPMDYSKRNTWDGRTHGFPDHPPAGGVSYNINTRQWVDANGAVVAYLYLPNGGSLPGYWKLGNNSVQGHDPNNDADWIKYYPTDPGNPDDPDGEWKIVSTDTVVTTSLFRVKPEAGKKLIAKLARVVGADATVIPAPLHMTFYTKLDATGTKVGDVIGPVAVKDHVYRTVTEIKRGANRIESDGAIVFDYDKTVPIVIDSLYDQRIDVMVEGHARMTGTDTAMITYICQKKGSH